MTNIPKNTENLNDDSLNSKMDTKNQTEDKTTAQPQIKSNLPVLAKDEFYLSKLERELSRGSASNKNLMQNIVKT